MSVNLLNDKELNDYLIDLVWGERGMPIILDGQSQENMMDANYIEQNKDAIVRSILTQYMKHRIRAYLTESEDYPFLTPVSKRADLPDWATRAILSRFNFSREDVDKAVKNISGGEKVKLKLAELIQQDINTLILDEPTNHIDIPTRESLEDALDEFDGTIIFVSHDRFFIKKFANKIVEFKNGKTKTFDGDYEYYLSLSNSSNVPLIQKVMYFDKSSTR